MSAKISQKHKQRKRVSVNAEQNGAVLHLRELRVRPASSVLWKFQGVLVRAGAADAQKLSSSSGGGGASLAPPQRPASSLRGTLFLLLLLLLLLFLRLHTHFSNICRFAERTSPPLLHQFPSAAHLGDFSDNCATKLI